MDNQQICQRYDVARTKRKSVEQYWNDVTRYVFPYRGDFFTDYISEGSVNWSKNRAQFDSTAAFAAESLAASVHGALTSPSTQWFTLRFRDDETNEDQQAKEWLEDCQERVYQALQDSNFNLEANETYMDLVGYGTSVLVEEVPDETEWAGVDFQVIPIRECFFDQDHKGNVINLYRRLEWEPLQILDFFGEDGTPENIKEQALKGASSDVRHEVVFCIFQRRDKQDADVSKPLPPTERPYGFKYVLVADKKLLGEEGGYYEMPAFVPRWRRTSGSQWGNSPSMKMMPDIKTLNESVRNRLVAQAKVIDPCIFAEQDVFLGDLDLNPGGFNTVRRLDGFREFVPNANFGATFENEGQLRQHIRQGYHVDELELKESPAMTATEVQVRYELMQRLLGPTLGRLQSDFLDPLITRTFNILYRAGQLQEIPETVQQSAAEMDIEYGGPLVRAQRADRVAEIDRAVESIKADAEFYPDVLDLVDWDKVERERVKLLGAPATILREESEVTQVRQQRAQQQQEMQRQEMLQAQGESMEKLGKGMGELKAVDGAG